MEKQNRIAYIYVRIFLYEKIFLQHRHKNTYLTHAHFVEVHNDDCSSDLGLRFQHGSFVN